MDPQGSNEGFENRKSACAGLALYASSRSPPQQVACLKPSLRTLAGSLSRPFRESKSSVFLTDLQEGQLEAQ